MDKQNIDQHQDKQIVSRVLQGDTAAFGMIIKNTERLVASIVFKLIPVNADRKDIAQDIYIKAFKQLAGFQFRSKLSTWIGQIAYHTCLNYLEKKKLVLVEDLAQQFELVNANYAELLLHRKELAAILEREMALLPPLYGTLIYLFYQEEMSQEEIMQITGLPEGTVKSYLFRARKQLKENILKKHKKEDL